MHRLTDDPVDPRGFYRWRVRSCRKRDRNQRVARRSVVGEPTDPERDSTSDVLRGTTLERRTTSRGIEIARARRLEGGRGGECDGILHGAPAGATAQVRRERSIDVDGRDATLLEQGRRPHHDPWCAESALRATRGEERLGECVPMPGVESVDRGDRATGDPFRRRDTGDPGAAVDQHGAAAALALGRATVLHRHDPEALAQDREEGFTGCRRDLYGHAITEERDPTCI